MIGNKKSIQGGSWRTDIIFCGINLSNPAWELDYFKEFNKGLRLVCVKNKEL
jgi:hypothetical protein